MAIENYIRTEGYHFDDRGQKMECIPGLEWRTGDDLGSITEDLQDSAKEFSRSHDHLQASGDMVGWIMSNYPDRAYFVETEKYGCGLQVYDPRDFVKERCHCGTTCKRS